MKQRKEITLNGKLLMVSSDGEAKQWNKYKWLWDIGWKDIPQREARWWYLNITFWIPNHKTKSILVHRLVWYAFLWLDIEDKKMCVCHKNDIRTDNRLENLFLWTYQENTRDAVRKWRQYITRWEENANSTYTESFIREIKQRLKNWEIAGRLYKEYWIPKWTMYDIRKWRLRWRIEV